MAARNSEGEDTIWVQMLVLVILAVSLAVFSLARAKANKLKIRDPSLGPRDPFERRETSNGRRVSKSPAAKPNRKSEKDLNSGMELLELNFLLNIVENTNGGDDEKDVIIRKLNFKELLRRGKLNQADSNALKIYAINKGNLYGKDIQCEAIKSLAERTTKGNKRSN